jgi:CheY-like chemotaxis protein
MKPEDTDRLRPAEGTQKPCDELRRAQQAVAQQERLRALCQMARGIVHDVNNAMCPVAAYSELLILTLPDLAKEQEHQLQAISRAAREVTEIVARLREFYQSDPGPCDSASAGVGQANRDLNEQTCVRLTFPIPERPVPSPQANDAALKPSRSMRILCIDDEPDMRALLRDCLAHEHHQVSVASGGREGLEMFRSSLSGGRPFQVVITDLGMPDMDGYDVARAIKEASPGTPILMLTGWDATAKTGGDSAPEVDAVLNKPAQLPELNSLLQRLAAKQ